MIIRRRNQRLAFVTALASLGAAACSSSSPPMAAPATTAAPASHSVTTSASAETGDASLASTTLDTTTPPSSTAAPTTSSTAPLGDPSLCPLGAAAAGAPMEIDFWSAESDLRQETLQRLVDQYNDAHPDVHISLLAKDAAVVWPEAVSSGHLPDLVLASSTYFLRPAIDSEVVVPAGACMAADGLDTSDFLPRMLPSVSIDGAVWAIPFNHTERALFYNPLAFEAAGLDPQHPPATLAELHEMATKIVDSGYTAHGVSWQVDESTVLTTMLARAGVAVADHDNGRSGMSEHLLLDNDAARQIFTTVHEMAVDGTLITAADQGTCLLAVGNKDVAMCLGAPSNLLGDIDNAMREQSFPGVEVGIAPEPAVSAPVVGASELRGFALYLMNGEDPAKIEAAYRFATWLSEPAQQAAWHLATGSIPVRASVADDPAVQARWNERSVYRVIFDDASGSTLPPHGGAPVFGPFGAVNDALNRAILTAADPAGDPTAAIAGAVAEVDAALANYASLVPG